MKVTHIASMSNELRSADIKFHTDGKQAAFFVVEVVENDFTETTQQFGDRTMAFDYAFATLEKEYRS